MPTEISNKLGIREGLIQVMSVEPFQDKPRSAPNTCVVVMEKRGGILRHYCTLHPDRDYKWSIGERIWGNFTCYVVDLRSREFRVDEKFMISDRVNNVRVITAIPYRVINGELVAIGVEDALASMREDVVTALKREIIRLDLMQITESALEERIYKEYMRFRNNLGIEIQAPRITVDWGEEILAQRREALKQQQAWEVEDGQRKREQRIQDEDRHRATQLENEDIDHIDQVIRRLGLQGVPADLRLRLHAMPRKEALTAVIAAIEEQRKFARQIMEDRMKEEYALLRKMIDDKILEDMDLAEFGRTLLERYQHSLAVEEAFGMPSAILFGDAQRPKLSGEKKGENDAPSAPSENNDKPAEEKTPPASDKAEGSQ
jgi:hypothetical protein